MIDIEQVRAAYQAGRTCYEIAEDLGVHESTVRALMDTKGVTRRRTGPRGRVDVPDSLITTLRDVEGMTWRAIADTVGMSRMGATTRYKVATGDRQYGRTPPEWRRARRATGGY